MRLSGFIDRLPSVFLAVFACFLWSTAFVGIKVGLQYTTPFFFAGVRFMLSRDYSDAVLARQARLSG